MVVTSQWLDEYKVRVTSKVAVTGNIKCSEKQLRKSQLSTTLLHGRKGQHYFRTSLDDAQHKKARIEKKQASSRIVPLSKALNGIPSFLSNSLMVKKKAGMVVIGKKSRGGEGTEAPQKFQK